ncbi:alpha-ribazole phosphatase [Desulfosporosinus fructosivorans]
MENRTIYLVRHGHLQTVDDLRRYIGHSDIPLNEVGILQAYKLQKKIVQAGIQSVYCSDLSRSTQTAEIIVGDKKVPIISRHELREINMGEWEGCSFSDIANRFPNEFKRRGEDIENYCVRGGESFADCRRRVLAVFQEIMETAHGDILVVAHAGVNRLLLCHVLGLPLANIFRLYQDYGCLNIIHHDQAGYRVKLLNER